MLHLLEAALFGSAPVVGSTDCAAELFYVGYKRVPTVTDGLSNLTEIVFPASDQDEPVYATHVAVIDGCGVIVAVHAF